MMKPDGWSNVQFAERGWHSIQYRNGVPMTTPFRFGHPPDLRYRTIDYYLVTSELVVFEDSNHSLWFYVVIEKP